MNTFIEMFSYSFMVRALVVGVLISLSASLVGVPLVLRNKSMLGDGLSHVAFSAFALASVLDVFPLWFTVLIVIIASFFVLRIDKNKKNNGDVAIAVLSVTSLAIGTMVISVFKGVNIDLNSYLFGSVLSVGWGEVWLSLILAVVVVLIYVFSYHRIFAITFDEEFTRAIGINTRKYETVLAIICSVVVVLGMRLLGALLISGLIVFPTLIASQFSKSFKRVVVFSALISVINFIVGLVISYLFALPTGSTVIVVNFVILFVSKILKKA